MVIEVHLMSTWLLSLCFMLSTDQMLFFLLLYYCLLVVVVTGCFLSRKNSLKSFYWINSAQLSHTVLISVAHTRSGFVNLLFITFSISLIFMHISVPAFESWNHFYVELALTNQMNFSKHSRMCNHRNSS